MKRGWTRKLLEALPEPASGDRFSAVRIGESEVRLARRRGAVALLLPAAVDDLQPDLRLANLTVSNRAQCRFTELDSQHVEDLAIVECTSADSRVQAAFLDLLEWLLPEEGTLPIDAVRSLSLALVQLFRSLEGAARTSALGLWGELWIIAGSSDVSAAASAWHAQARSRWDFSWEEARAEVKTTTGQREHHFSLEQLLAPQDTLVVVASIVTTELSSGPSIEELLSDIVQNLHDPELRSRTIEVCIASLGSGWQQGRGARFDASLAAQTLRFIDAEDVPKVGAVPAEVSAVSFVSDVEDVDPMDEDRLVDAGVGALLRPML